MHNPYDTTGAVQATPQETLALRTRAAESLNRPGLGEIRKQSEILHKRLAEIENVLELEDMPPSVELEEMFSPSNTIREYVPGTVERQLAGFCGDHLRTLRSLDLRLSRIAEAMRHMAHLVQD